MCPCPDERPRALHKSCSAVYWRKPTGVCEEDRAWGHADGGCGAGRLEITANLLASAAYQASWLNQNAEANTLLDIAERLPDQPPPRLSAVIAQREVFAAGRRRDTDALRRARDTAHDQLERAGNDDPWWSAWLSHHAVDSATGRAWLAAQDPDAAEPYLPQSLAAVDDAGLYPRDHMLAVLDLADTHRLRGDRAAALDLTRQATIR
ncbi:hypothetical protein ACFXP3_21880 [Streptomyces sp. NPDC059096]|uniref:hypothetical protein n=1 Tax=Streptomyces sp. NPDC059096 TaxID=3346727 RepID=UPI003694A9B8